MNLHRIQPNSGANSQQNKTHLTLIHGWASESAVWLDWAQQHFAEHYQLTLIDLPGFGQSPTVDASDNTLETWLDALNDALPDQPTHLIGWSLGGLLAQQLTLKHPEKVLSLTCLASTPRFTQNDGWTKSVSPQIIADFIKAVKVETASLLQKFWRLQFQGSEHSRELMKKFGKHMAMCNQPTLKGLAQGLELLRDIDNREQLHHISVPTFWLLGEKDPLIPVDIRENLPELQPNAQIEILAGASHVPFFSQPEASAAAIKHFIEQSS